MSWGLLDAFHELLGGRGLGELWEVCGLLELG